jgi:HAD superfamily hydrolase (TIGR01549 family)
MIKVAVGFDFDHTLGIDHSLERHAFGDLAEQFGVALDIGEEQTADMIEQMLAPFRAAEEKMPAMLARFAARLENAEMLAVPPEELAARFRQICYDLVEQLVKPIEGASECIAQLVAHGIPVGILTNGWSQLQERKIECALGDFPGPILVSDSLGAYKPSAQAFRELEAALGVGPEGLWYVGDNPVADIAGARAYGLRAVWLNRGGHDYPAGLTPPTAVIQKLAALEAIVRGT